MSRIISAFAQWAKDTARYYNTVYELSRLSDRELEHLGLNRSEIVLLASQQMIKQKQIYE